MTRNEWLFQGPSYFDKNPLTLSEVIVHLLTYRDNEPGVGVVETLTSEVEQLRTNTAALFTMLFMGETTDEQLLGFLQKNGYRLLEL